MYRIYGFYKVKKTCVNRINIVTALFTVVDICKYFSLPSTWPQKREAFAKLKANFVSETTLETMLGFIRTCHSLDKSFSSDDDGDGEDVVKEREQGGGGNPIQTAASVFRAITGILPGMYFNMNIMRFFGNFEIY